MADRDVYMWCYSSEGVNGVCEAFARNFKKSLQSRPRGRRRNRFCRRLEERFLRARRTRPEALLAELRRFYRLGSQSKLRHAAQWS